MSREKQIEEMIVTVKNAVCDNATIEFDEDRILLNGNDIDHVAEQSAEDLYNAGYRKFTDVAEEIFADIDDFQHTLRHIFLNMCGGNDYNTLNLLQIDNAIEALFDSKIAELKNKYTEEKING